MNLGFKTLLNFFDKKLDKHVFFKTFTKKIQTKYETMVYFWNIKINENQGLNIQTDHKIENKTN